MSEQTTIQIPKHIRKIFKEWALDFHDAGRRFGKPESMQLAAHLDFYRTISSPTAVKWSFLQELLYIAVGHIANDYSSVEDERTRRHLFNLQHESREMAAWLSGVLRLPNIYTWDACGNRVVVYESP